MFSNISHDLALLVYSMEHNFLFTILVLLGLFAIHFLNKALKYRLNYLGIYPRHILGLRGIVFSPFLHGDFNHLFFNSFPLFALMHMILLNGMPVFIYATLFIMIAAGLFIWVFGRPSLHIGASTVILGYFGFLAAQSYFAPSFLSVLVILTCLYYFFGLVLSLFPTDKSVSFEGHLFGFLAGMLAYLAAPKLIPYIITVL